MGRKMDDEFKDPELCFTSLIDIVFLLLIFFMCASRFKQVEMRLDAFLPTDEGQMAVPVQQLKKPEELSIFIKDDQTMRSSPDFNLKATRKANYYLASRDATPVQDPMQLLPKLQQLAANPEQEVLIALYNETTDKDQLVPFFNVVKVIDLCKAAGINKIKFQAPAQTQ
ncbi:MAG: biopolymer transporter ExbD [Planctomycetota bacterium]|nr:biopolymer transporter ExbD [Planctomycetota bacterium]